MLEDEYTIVSVLKTSIDCVVWGGERLRTLLDEIYQKNVLFIEVEKVRNWVLEPALPLTRYTTLGKL